MSQFSRFKSNMNIYTSHYKNENQFIKDILSICSENNIKLILPSHNETEIFARNKDLFKGMLPALFPDEAHCKIFNNKSSSYDLVEDLGIPTPKRIKYKNTDNLYKILKKEDCNHTVIKLLTGNSSKGVFYANSPLKAQKIVKNLIKEYNLDINRLPQVEERIEGEGYGCSVLYWKGEYITHFTHRRLREKILTGGTSTYREASINKNIEIATKKIFDSIGYNGLAMCEFKVCKKTGKFWFIEVNPRMWGSISLPIEAGTEFPYLAWLCATKGPEAAKQYDQERIKDDTWRAKWLLGEAFLLISLLRELKFKEIYKIFTEKKPNSIDDFFWDDPLVLLGEIFAYLKSTILNRSTNPSEKGMIG